MKRFQSLLLSIFSGLMLVFAWPVSSFTFLIFFAWIPILFLAEKESKTVRFFWFSYLALLIWNIGTTWWIWNSTGPGAVAAVIGNSFFMSVPLWAFHRFKKKFGDQIGHVSFVVFWLTFEYIHLTWQLSWPWLTLGNVFAMRTNWIQWYEYTGACGGSLWVLLFNMSLFLLIRHWKTEAPKSNILRLATSIFILLLPIGLSQLVTSDNVQARSLPASNTNIIIVQPNIDPYSEKFEVASTEGQIQKLIALSEKQVDANTKLVLWPETALPQGVLQNKLKESLTYKPVFDFVNRHPGLTLQTGIETFKDYGTTKATNTARKSEADGTYYDVFNSAVSITANQPLQFYNKSKLVPGVETLPDFLLFLGSIFEQFGGTAGGYGHDKEAIALKVSGNPYITAPIICYESIYGEYTTNYIRKGANLLTIMTNDGWWANTAGHKQHLQYARLRAIETRKWVARSANTGVSAVINDRGDILETRPWDTSDVIKYNIPPVNGETFFVRNGALIFGFATFFCVTLVIYYLVMILRKRFLPRR